MLKSGISTFCALEIGGCRMTGSGGAATSIFGNTLNLTLAFDFEFEPVVSFCQLIGNVLLPYFKEAFLAKFFLWTEMVEYALRNV